MTTITKLRPPRRRSRRAVLGLLALLLVLTGQPPARAVNASAPELAFVQLVNAERAERGLIPLQLSPVVSDQLSRPWSTSMASRRQLTHSGSGREVLDAVGRRLPGVSMAGENVGYAPTVESLHRALMDSAGHRTNILDPEFRLLGLGIATSGRRVWVTQTFFATGSGAGLLPRARRPGLPAAAPHHRRGAISWHPSSGAAVLRTLTGVGSVPPPPQVTPAQGRCKFLPSH
jgi:uncharacterized protein YkwD